MSVHIPHFDEKFRQIFGDGGPIRTYGELADAINVTAPLITGWKRGTDYSRPEQIPRKHIANVCEALDVTQDLLEMADLAGFISRLRDRPRPSLWDQMVAQAATNEHLRILREDEVLADRTLLSTQRGVIVPDEPIEGLPVFATGEKFVVRFGAEAAGHILLLIKDRSGWECLHPTAQHLRTSLDGVFLFPNENNPDKPRFAQFTPPIGVHRLVAVLTPEPVPDKLTQALVQDGDLPRTLLQLAAHLQRQRRSGAGGDMIQVRFQVGT